MRGDAVIDLNLARAMLLASRGQDARYLATDALDFIRQGETALDSANETLEFLGSRMVEGMVFKPGRLSAARSAAQSAQDHRCRLELWFASPRAEHSAGRGFLSILFPQIPDQRDRAGGDHHLGPGAVKAGGLRIGNGVVIGKTATRVKAEQALDHVFGFCNLNDISARDLRMMSGRATVRARQVARQPFCPIGPFIASRDEIPDPQNLAIRGLGQCEVRQDANTAFMINSVAQLIAFISNGITLTPGDIIASGTPAGVGHHRNHRSISNRVTCSKSRWKPGSPAQPGGLALARATDTPQANLEEWLATGGPQSPLLWVRLLWPRRLGPDGLGRSSCQRQNPPRGGGTNFTDSAERDHCPRAHRRPHA